jgi:hypothetical protein
MWGKKRKKNNLMRFSGIFPVKAKIFFSTRLDFYFFSQKQVAGYSS